jgi:hypothetical protein
MVLGVSRVGQRPPTDAEHHTGVAAEDGGERGLIAVGEPAEQLGVGPARRPVFDLHRP